MSNRYKEYFENVKPDDNLKNDTLRKMREVMITEAAPKKFDIKPIAAIAACAAVAASALLLAPDFDKEDPSGNNDQVMENISTTVSSSDESVNSYTSESSSVSTEIDTYISTSADGTVSEISSQNNTEETSAGTAESDSKENTSSPSGNKPESVNSVTTVKPSNESNAEKPVSSSAASAKPVTTANKENDADPEKTQAALTTKKPETMSPASAPTTSRTTYPANTARPTSRPTAAPTTSRTASPTARPTSAPTAYHTAAPTSYPTARPTSAPTAYHTAAPTSYPTARPTAAPTAYHTAAPTSCPTGAGAAAPGDTGNTESPTGNGGSSSAPAVTPTRNSDTAADSPETDNSSVSYEYAYGTEIPVNNGSLYSNFPSYENIAGSDYINSVYETTVVSQYIFDCYNFEECKTNKSPGYGPKDGAIYYFSPGNGYELNIAASQNGIQYGYFINSVTSYEKDYNGTTYCFKKDTSENDVYVCSFSRNGTYYSVYFKKYTLTEIINILQNI